MSLGRLNNKQAVSFYEYATSQYSPDVFSLPMPPAEPAPAEPKSFYESLFGGPSLASTAPSLPRTDADSTSHPNKSSSDLAREKYRRCKASIFTAI